MRFPLLLCLVPVTALVTASIAASPPRAEGRSPSSLTAVQAAVQVFPVSGACWYTDTWQAPRSGGRFHEGVDIGAAAGTQILAVADGKITKMYADRPDFRGGNALRLTTADGTYFFYGHLQAFAEGIAVGSAVVAGQTIGYVGHTGNAGVDHLHLEVHPGGGAPVNPYPVVKAINGCGSSGRPAAAATNATVAPVNTTAAGTPATTLAGAPAPFTPSPVGSPGCQATHTVVAGDYWYLISARYSTPVRALTAANGRSPQSWIFVGENLCLPAPEWVPPPTAAAPPAAAPVTTVAAPVATTVPSNPSGVTSTTLPVARPKAIPKSECAEFYEIQPGDFWVMLGNWYQKRASRIAAANGKLLTDPVYPGDVICIPR